ncbi:hypothetical protein KSF78_0002158 [Schistosoma japonicum]|nr:hypothetical protein KSF78_0002158 [Schistosoma japonicum]
MSTFVLILICNLPNVNCLPTSDDEKIDLLKSVLADEINKELAKLPQNDQPVQIDTINKRFIDSILPILSNLFKKINKELAKLPQNDQPVQIDTINKRFIDSILPILSNLFKSFFSGK